ncbi:MAG: ATP phosphoribosyltransferase regulatory subunit [Betaproteobacteria bacterium]|nr:ATP phosphoribosyltransferase regulatory subunit [Betaproteobacteria bacterium]
MHSWVLPEFIEDILPAEALCIERMRRDVLDLLHVHGYQIVMPPLLEYVESLLSGTGHDMDLRMFKVVDQISGRMMGLRADITPQAARIDAHLLNRNGVTRLCYAGSVLHTLPSGLTRTREPLQVGAELYGHAGLESDVEIQQLMLKSLQRLGLEDVQLDLGHVAVFRSLMRRAGIAGEQESELFQVLQAKDIPSLRELGRSIDPGTRDALIRLPELYGGPEALKRARRELPSHPEITRALAELGRIAAELKPLVGELCFDLAELRGYHYHSGVVFAAYAAGCPNAVALGGRYDEVGKAFGRARPATGFSMDLRELCGLVPQPPFPAGILAPRSRDPALAKTVEKLRGKGEIVVVDLPGHEKVRHELNCDRKLVKKDGKWIVVALAKR